MTDIQIIKHKQKPWAHTPYATITIKPDDSSSSEVVEKDLHFGLFVLGTEKHESRRIDNQLRGRSGRQWDAGLSQFYVALDDEIMRKMWGDTIKSIAKRLLPAEELSKLELTQSQFTSSITRAQKQMEWYNFSIRKHLFEYDNVVNKQRMKVYGKRDELLNRTEDQKDHVLHEVALIIHEVVRHIVANWKKADQEFGELVEMINQVFGVDILEKNQNIIKTANHKDSSLVSDISGLLVEEWDSKTHIIVEDVHLIQIIKTLFLESIDKYRIEHIDTMQHLREKVWLYGYAQQDPLVIYKQEAYKLYSDLWIMIKTEFLGLLFKVDFTQFHGMNGAINFDIVDTNEEAFDDSLIGDMTSIQDTPGGNPVPQTAPQHHQTEKGIEVIDLSATQKTSSVIDKKVGPNQPCPCGSGKKYKKCHGSMR